MEWIRYDLMGICLNRFSSRVCASALALMIFAPAIASAQLPDNCPEGESPEYRTRGGDYGYAGAADPGPWEPASALVSQALSIAGQECASDINGPAFYEDQPYEWGGGEIKMLCTRTSEPQADFHAATLWYDKRCVEGEECNPENQPKNQQQVYEDFAEYRASTGGMCDGSYQWTPSAGLGGLWLGSTTDGYGVRYMDKTCQTCAVADTPESHRTGDITDQGNCVIGATGKVVCADSSLEADESCPGGKGTVNGQEFCAQVPEPGTCVTTENGTNVCSVDAEAPKDADGEPKAPDVWGSPGDGTAEDTNGDGVVDGNDADGQRDFLGIYGGGQVGTPGGGGSGGGAGEGEGEGSGPGECNYLPVACDIYDWFTDESGRTDPDEPVWNVEEIGPGDLPDKPNQLPSSGASCPSDTIQVFDLTIAVPYQPFCDLAVMIRPLVIAAAWLLAIVIVVRD